MADNQLILEVLNDATSLESVLVLQGVLNAGTAFQFRDSVRNLPAHTVIVDMSRVRYVDSTGLGVLIGAYVTFERDCRRLLLAGLNDRIWDLFRTCRLEEIFTRYPSVDSARHTP